MKIKDLQFARDLLVNEIDFGDISSIVLDENGLSVICQKDECLKKLERGELK